MSKRHSPDDDDDDDDDDDPEEGEDNDESGEEQEEEEEELDIDRIPDSVPPPVDEDADDDDEEEEEEEEEEEKEEAPSRPAAKRQKKKPPKIYKAFGYVRKYIPALGNVEVDIIFHTIGDGGIVKKKKFCKVVFSRDDFPFLARFVYVMRPTETCIANDYRINDPRRDFQIAYILTDSGNKDAGYRTDKYMDVLTNYPPLKNSKDLALQRVLKNKGKGVTRITGKLDSIAKLSFLGNRTLFATAADLWGNCFRCKEYYLLWSLRNFGAPVDEMTDDEVKALWSKLLTRQGRVDQVFTLGENRIWPVAMKWFNGGERVASMLMQDVDEMEVALGREWMSIYSNYYNDPWDAFIFHIHPSAEMVEAGFVKKIPALQEGEERIYRLSHPHLYATDSWMPRDMYECLMDMVQVSQDPYFHALNGFATDCVAHNLHMCNEVYHCDAPLAARTLVVCQTQGLVYHTRKAVGCNCLVLKQALEQISAEVLVMQRLVIFDYAHCIAFEDFRALSRKMLQVLSIAHLKKADDPTYQFDLYLCGIAAFGAEYVNGTMTAYHVMNNLFSAMWPALPRSHDYLPRKLVTEESIRCSDQKSDGAMFGINEGTGAMRTLKVQAYNMSNPYRVSQLLQTIRDQHKHAIVLANHSTTLPQLQSNARPTTRGPNAASTWGPEISTGQTVVDPFGTQVVMTHLFKEELYGAQRQLDKVDMNDPTNPYNIHLRYAYMHFPERWVKHQTAPTKALPEAMCTAHKFARADTVVYISNSNHVLSSHLDTVSALALKNVIIVLPTNFREALVVENPIPEGWASIFGFLFRK